MLGRKIESINESKSDAPNAAESPISSIFSKYTAQTLVKYETYYQEMMRDMLKIEHRLREQLRKDLAPLIASLDRNNSKDDSNTNSDEKVVELFEEIFSIDRVNNYNVNDKNNSYATSLSNNIGSFRKYVIANCNLNSNNISNVLLPRLDVFNKQMNLTQDRFDHSCSLLFESYENYMKSVAPAPFLLPINVTIRLKKRHQFWDLTLKSTDRIGMLIETIEKKFRELGDPINKWHFIGGNANANNDASDRKENENNNDNAQAQKKNYMFGLLRPLDQRNLDEPLEVEWSFLFWVYFFLTFCCARILKIVFFCICWSFCLSFGCFWQFLAIFCCVGMWYVEMLNILLIYRSCIIRNNV